MLSKCYKQIGQLQSVAVRIECYQTSAGHRPMVQKCTNIVKCWHLVPCRSCWSSSRQFICVPPASRLSSILYPKTMNDRYLSSLRITSYICMHVMCYVCRYACMCEHGFTLTQLRSDESASFELRSDESAGFELTWALASIMHHVPGILSSTSGSNGDSCVDLYLWSWLSKRTTCQDWTYLHFSYADI